MRKWGLVFSLAAAGTLLAASAQDRQKEIRDAIQTIRSVGDGGAHYQYAMTASVRLGLFWVTREDVGVGSIKVGREASGAEFIRLVIGSDPDKAPMGINRWGAATEVQSGAGSVFFGLIRPTENESPLAARRAALESEPRFRVLLGTNKPGETVAVNKLVAMPREFTVREAQAVQAAALNHLETPGQPVMTGEASEGCNRCSGFLFSVRELVQEAVAGARAPAERCYRYNGKVLTLKMARNQRVAGNLRRLQFEVRDSKTGERHGFDLVVGTQGELAGVPVRIEYRPNWWLKLVLILRNEGPQWERARRAGA